MNTSLFLMSPLLNNETVQNGPLSASMFNYPFSNANFPPMQIRTPQDQLMDLLTADLQLVSSSLSNSFFNTSIVPSDPLESFGLISNRINPSIGTFPFQTSVNNEFPLLNATDFLFGPSLESRLLTEFFDLERRTLQTFEMLLESGLLEEQKEQGLNRDQIDRIEVSEFEGPAKEPVSRLKSRNGIHKKAKHNPKKIIKEAILKEKSEPTSSSTCAICYEDYINKDKLRKLPCLHKFHRECIDKWLSLKNNCPVCKQKPIEEIQQNESRDMTRLNLFNHDDFLQFLTSERPFPTISVPNFSTNNLIPRLPTQISNNNTIRNVTTIVIPDDGNNNPIPSQSSTRQARRTSSRRGIESGRKTSN